MNHIEHCDFCLLYDATKKTNKQTVRKSQEMNKKKSWNKTGNHESILIEVYIVYICTRFSHNK